ncbi:MAG: acetate/propionate family kinase [Candidatus Competibacteraceae bacterium]|nr:acetate/propionate family kinase [Candidatus Competibacteraceae bacterium]MBK9950686.1 acetate/propionate family kinase [Candidatus Competibacteraceae bacterium]
MSKGLLVINAGSSSIKFSVFALAAKRDLALVCRGVLESIGEESPRFKAFDHAGTVLADVRPTPPSGQYRKAGADHRRRATDAPSVSSDGEVYDHQIALRDLLDWLDKKPELPEIVAAGHRVVHGGKEFSDPQRLTPEIMARLETFIPLAPLHQPHNLAGIRALTAVRPDLPQVACFDTAFHFGQPELARVFALPKIYRQEGVQRYGFHGLSYEYIAGALAEEMETSTTGRVVVAHLGNGASMCAMRDGKSMASTMGFTAVEGLPMGTRSGSLDPGVLLYLLERHGMGVRDLNNLLYKQSGLLGLSGISNDMRELLASSDPNAQLAVDYFTYRIARELGSLAAALGGLDALVFTGGIGENATAVREQVCVRSGWLGIELDAVANAERYTRISTPASRVTVWVLPTNEELIIARHTRQLVLEH